MLLELLRRIEWSGRGVGGPNGPSACCPDCCVEFLHDKDGTRPHAPTCDLAACIRQLVAQSRGKPARQADTPVFEGDQT